jgi:integrase/recombinase XerD
MSNREFKAQFQSALGSLLEQFVKEKQACGYPYHGTARILAQFDRFLCDEALSQCELPRSINRKWLAKRPHESAGTQWQRTLFVNSPSTCAGWAIPPMCRTDH